MPTFLDLAHRHVAEWLEPEKLKEYENWLVGPLASARKADIDEEWEIPGLAPPAWW